MPTCVLRELNSVKNQLKQWNENFLATQGQIPGGGLAAAFDLAAYDGYMIARVKKSVNHSRIIQSMRQTNMSFLFPAPLFVFSWK